MRIPVSPPLLLSEEASDAASGLNPYVYAEVKHRRNLKKEQF